MDRIPLPRPRVLRAARSDPPHRASPTPVWGTLSTKLAAGVASLSVVLLAACGGGDSAELGTGGTGLASAGSAPQPRAASVDFARESPYGPGDAPGAKVEMAAGDDLAHRAAEPVDRQAHTRRGLYLGRATAELAYQESGGHAVWIDASCCGGLDPELPERIAFGMQAIVGDDAPLYVSGSDLRQAARLVDRFDTIGLRRVYLITP